MFEVVNTALPQYQRERDRNMGIYHNMVRKNGTLCLMRSSKTGCRCL